MPSLHWIVFSPDQAFLLTGRRSRSSALDFTQPCVWGSALLGWLRQEQKCHEHYWTKESTLHTGWSTKRCSFVLDGGAVITVPARAEYTGSCSLPLKDNQLFSRFQLWYRNNCFKVDPESIFYLKQPLYLIWIKFQFLMRAGQEGFQACEYELCDATCQTSQNTYRGDISSHCQH